MRVSHIFRRFVDGRSSPARGSLLRSWIQLTILLCVCAIGISFLGGKRIAVPSRRANVDPGSVDWSRFKREVPSWFRDAKFGIMIHWGPYSVPAWAEPIGELGAVESSMAHNPYSEWYLNTMRIPGSPTAKYHEETYGNAPYDDFIDAWKAEKFNPKEWATLFANAGAKYVIPVSKHHDGVTLWDAPGTGTRNTVHRGPRRDLIGDMAAAFRAAGLRFGVYYSGGLDWNITTFPAITAGPQLKELRPKDAAYAMYAHAHVTDLIERYRPDVLWNDIEWPDAGKREGPHSLADLFDRFYATVPHGVVNDRWGRTHSDFGTSEYQMMRDREGPGRAWENCRGVGYSFGYNRREAEAQSLAPAAAVRYLVDVVARGGNLLLNVGPTAAGEIPPVQRRALEGIAAWMAVNSESIHGTAPVPALPPAGAAGPGGAGGAAAAGAGAGGKGSDVWVRWTGTPQWVYAHVDAPAGGGAVEVPAGGGAVAAAADLASGFVLGGAAAPARLADGGRAVELTLPARSVAGPAVVRFRRVG